MDLEGVEREATIDLIRAAPDDLRAKLILGWSEADGAVATRLERLDHPQFNRGFRVSQIGRSTLESWVRGYRAAGCKRFAIQVAPDAPPELREQLSALGLTVTSRWAKLRQNDAPAVAPSCALRLQPVERHDALALGRVVCAGFGMPPALAPWVASVVGREHWRAFMAWDAGEPVAAGLCFVHGDQAWLGLDATLPSHRGRGAQAALIARRVADAGARSFVAETGEGSGSFRNYLRAGFSLAWLRDNFTQT